MSKHADVTVILTESGKQSCSFKLSNWPVGIYRDSFYRTFDSNWFIAKPGYLRQSDAMILVWYDGISCFIQVNEGISVIVNDKIYDTKNKITIRHGDTIRIRDAWKVRRGEICLEVEIHCVAERMNFDLGKKRPVSLEQNIAYKPAPQNQIWTIQPTQVPWTELTDTQQKLDLKNPTLKTIHPNTENVQMQRDIVNSIPPGKVAKMKKFYDSNGPDESKKGHNMPVRKTKASQKYLKSSKSKTDLFVQCSSEQCHEHMSEEKNKKTNLREKSTASQSVLLSFASNGDVSGNEMREQYGDMNQNNTQKEENTTARQNVLLSLASHGDTSDDDMRDDYYEMDQSNTQQEVQLKRDETLPIPNHDVSCDSNMYTQDHSEIDNNNIYEGLPMKGVSNMGMTCYANGIFQILAQTQLFLNAIKPVVEMPYKPLTYSLWKLLEEINHPNQYFTENREVVRKLLDVIAKDSSFSSCQQDDCLEFLMHVLERLKEENQQSTSMFEMNLQTVIEHKTYPGPHVDKCDTQLSFHLLVPFYQEQKKENPTVKSCLNKMLNVVECFSGKELPCRYCSRTEAPRHRMSKHFVVSRSPDILILQIGRVEHMKFRTYSNLKKKNELVEYEHVLHIDEVHWDGCRRTPKRNYYQLYGVVLHSGNIECGHYYCFVKHRKTSEWFYCNDSLVYQIHTGMVLNDTNAYLLFYEKFDHNMTDK